MSTTTKPSYGQPALIGGLVMGVLSALPLVSAFNVCCCGWVLAGGAVAAYRLQQNQSTPIEPSDGAIAGLLAGLIGAVVMTLLSIPIDLLVGPYQRALVERIVDMAGSMPPEVRDALERVRGRERSSGFFVLRHLIGLVFWLFVGAIFSTVGGLIGAALFKKSPPPPSTA